MSAAVRPERPPPRPAPHSAEGVKWIRARLGLTQEQFSVLMGVHYITVARWETHVASPTAWASDILAALMRAPDPDPKVIRAALDTSPAHALAHALAYLVPPPPPAPRATRSK